MGEATEKNISSGESPSTSSGHDELFHLLIENMLEGVVIVDWDTTILFANKVAAQLLGFESPEEFIQHKSLEFVHPDSKELLLKNLHAVRCGENRIRNEYRFTTNKGDDVWFETNGTRINFKGRPADLVTFKDITERKRAEGLLVQSELRYRTLFESAPVGVGIATLDGRILDVNDIMTHMAGYSRAELEQINLEDTYQHPEDRTLLLEHIRENGFVRDFVVGLKRKDGTPYYASLNVAVCTLDGNEVLLTMAVDITEEKQAEEALRASEEKYRELVENMNDVIYTIDKEGVVTYVSPAVEAFVEYDPSEVIGRDFRAFFHEEDLPCLKENFQKILSGHTVTSEYRVISKSGTVRWMRTSSRPVFAKNRIVGVQGVLMDITDRKQAEEQIKTSLKEKEVLLREIHHRVKNNLQVISSLLNLQFEYCKDYQYARILKESQNRIHSMALIHEKLYQSENLADIDLNEYVTNLVQWLVRSYGAAAEQVALTIAVENVSLGIDAAIPCGLIINELVSNSLNYAFPGDRKGEITITIRSHDRMIELRVADNGVGIPDSIDFKNTGTLGLDLVTALAEDQLNGTIALDRTEGTAFIITFREVM